MRLHMTTPKIDAGERHTFGSFGSILSFRRILQVDLKLVSRRRRLVWGIFSSLRKQIAAQLMLCSEVDEGIRLG